MHLQHKKIEIFYFLEEFLLLLLEFYRDCKYRKGILFLSQKEAPNEQIHEKLYLLLNFLILEFFSFLYMLLLSCWILDFYLKIFLKIILMWA